MTYAVQFSELTGIDALNLQDVPEPVVSAGDVLISVRAATINPVDLGTISGLYSARMPGSAPWTPGWDLAGVVTAVGSGVRTDLVGRMVLGFSQWFLTGTGTHASVVALPEENVAVAPETLAPEQLTTFGLNALTAWQSLDAARVSPGGSVIVVGASGGVGRFVSQLAVSRGLRVIPVGRNTDRRELVGLQADAVVNSAPLDVTVLDGVRDGGRAVSVTAPYESVRGISTERVNVMPDRAALESIVELAQFGVLTTQVGDVVEAKRVRQAYALFEHMPRHERIVLSFDAS